MSHYFLAVPLPLEIKEQLYSYSKILRERLTYRYWTDIQDYHITMAFLGESSDEQLDKLKSLIKTSSYEWQPTSVKLNGFGKFGRPSEPRVLYMGVHADQSLFDIQSKVKVCTANCGFKTEDRPYRPHITIAKKWAGKEPIIENQWQEILPAYERNAWMAQAVTLYRVNPQKTPRYVAVSHFSKYKKV